MLISMRNYLEDEGIKGFDSLTRFGSIYNLDIYSTLSFPSLCHARGQQKQRTCCSNVPLLT
jgi:hypothetical protein